MAVAEVDVRFVGRHLGLDQSVVSGFVTAPTADLVLIFLKAVVDKATEYEKLAADKTVADIQLENAVRSSENRIQALKNTADAALAETQDLRQQLQNEESRRLVSETELHNLKSRVTESDSEASSLKLRVESLQESSRANLSLLEERNSRVQQLSEELTSQHERTVDLGKEISTLTHALRATEATVSTARYREESLKQQLELSTRSSQWFEQELKTKSDEALKFRRDKSARISELQRQIEDVTSELETFKRSEAQVRERLEAAQSKIEEILVKNQQRQEIFARTEESYRQEIKDQKRLVEMTKEYSQKHQDRVREVEAEKERLKENFENEVRRVRMELGKLSQHSVVLEEKNQQLEADLDQLRARHMANSPGSAPHTPGPANGMDGSSFGTPGSVRKRMISSSQTIDELYRVKGQLLTEKRRNQQIAEEMDNLMATLEAKAPEINELHAEVDSLRIELTKMSHIYQQSFEERDNAKRSARKAESELTFTRTEIKILRGQLRDLSMQIQMLVFNLQAHEKGIEYLTEEEAERFERLAHGRLTESSLDDMSDTQQFITERFAIFKNVQELQQKNQELLETTRTLAEKMESEEALAQQRQARDDHEEVERLTRDMQHMLDEASSVKKTMESYKSERDMFRRLLQQKASAGELASALGQNPDDHHRTPLASIETGSEVDVTASVTAALREQQAIFDGFRTEQAMVRRSMQDNIDGLSQEKTRLQSEIAIFTAQLTLASERYAMLQSNFAALQSQMQHMQESNRNLSLNAARQDLRMQQLSEDVIRAQGLTDSLQRESSNLKAEKELWKDIQLRLSKDNESLVEEKGRLNALIATQQSVLNQRDISEAELQRKSQDKTGSLERELVLTKDRLSKEVEDAKQLQLRKEFETKELQKRIDDLITNLRQIREESVSLKTSNEHMQARIQDLGAELRNSEDRYGRLLPRATPRANLPSDESAQEDDTARQELLNEVVDLKRELGLAKALFENAKEEIEHYKDLSRNTEEALEELTGSQEEVRLEMEGLLREKQSMLDDLRQRFSVVSTELKDSSSQLATLRESQTEAIMQLENQKQILEDEVRRMRDESSQFLEATKHYKKDLRAQAEIATKAHGDYEEELVKHAEAAKMVQALRADCSAIRARVSNLEVEAESARTALILGQNSWESREASLRQEIVELTSRKEDLNAQNRLLHQQLESVSAQVSALQIDRSSTAGPGQSGEAQDVTFDGLRELNGYILREKEIVEVQLDIKSSETRRLQEQLDVARMELDDVRLKLEQARNLHIESDKASISHRGLMEKLNELNVYRESSVTLRSELEQSRRVATENADKIEELSMRIPLLQAEIDGLQAQKGFLEEECKTIEEDRDRWQKRTEGILTKYGRADPVELEQMKESIGTLEAERDALRQTQEQLSQALEGAKSNHEIDKTGWAETRQKLTEQFKDRSRKLVGEKTEALFQVKELQDQLATDTAEAQHTNQKLFAYEGELAVLRQQVYEFRSMLESSRQSASAIANGPDDAAIQVSDQLAQQLAAVRDELEAVIGEKSNTESALGALHNELDALRLERDAAMAEVERLSGELAQAQAQHFRQPQAAVGGWNEERRALELAIAEAKMANADLSNNVTELTRDLAAAESRAAEAEERIDAFENNNTKLLKERSEKMKATLNEKLKESRARFEEEFAIKLHQEKLIWQAGMSEGAIGSQALSTAVKAADGSVAATGDINTGSEAAPAALSAESDALSGVDLSRLSDPEIRNFLATNTLVKGILSANVKKRVDVETAKLKVESDQKVAAAREAGEQLAGKKSTLRINISENKLRAAVAKLQVVETAAESTPLRPVGEVWEIAKATVAPRGTPANGNATTPIQAAINTMVPAVSALSAVSAVPSSPARADSIPLIPLTPTATAAPKVEDPQTGPPVSTPRVLQAPSGSMGHHSLPANPFSTSVVRPDSQANPFAVHDGGAASPTGGPATSLAVTQGQAQAQAQAQGGPRSGIPMARANMGRGRNGPGNNRAVSTGSEPQTLGAPSGPMGQMGRGAGPARNNRNGGRQGLNPTAADFNSGSNKRPRGDPDVGGGPGGGGAGAGGGGGKRMRGGHHG